MNLNRSHSIAGLFVYLLLGLFAVLSLALVLLGIKTYASASEMSAAHNNERILTNYVRTLLRGADGESEIYTETAEGIPMLTLKSGSGEDVYYTRLYAFEGHLCESFTAAELGFDPNNGEQLCECAAFVPTVENGVVTLVFTEASGTERTVYAALKAGR